jgi:hypothetical protein
MGVVREREKQKLEAHIGTSGYISISTASIDRLWGHTLHGLVRGYGFDIGHSRGCRELSVPNRVGYEN